MFEKLKICWYVLTRHTWALFFCTKDMKNIECYERNTFKVFNETIAEFMSNKSEKEYNMKQEEKIQLIPQKLYANAYIETRTDWTGEKHEDFRLGNLYKNKEDVPTHYEISNARAIHLGVVELEIKQI